jgi:hypothetical protein
MRENNQIKIISIFSFWLLLLIGTSGCNSSVAYILPPQIWNDTEFLVEIGSGGPRKGMNEFLVIVTQTDRVPGYTYIITIKTKASKKWSQMIQDGHSGVYRRAIAVMDPENDVLVVQLEHTKEVNLKTTLFYPLSKRL